MDKTNLKKEVSGILVLNTPTAAKMSVYANAPTTFMGYGIPENHSINWKRKEGVLDEHLVPVPNITSILAEKY